MPLEQIDPGAAFTANRPPAMAVVKMTRNNIVVVLKEQWEATMDRIVPSKNRLLYFSRLPQSAFTSVQILAWNCQIDCAQYHIG